MRGRRGWTLVDALVLVGVVVCVACLLPILSRDRERQCCGTNCKNNLKQLGLSLILYRDNQGKGTGYPPYSGADFLVKLYECGQNTEPDQFVCPRSGDDNDEGRLLRLGKTPPHGCSYAGRRNRDSARYPGLFCERGAAETVLAADDDEGRVKFNHADAIVVLFLDGHVEEIPANDPKVRAGVGKAPLLHPLAN